MDKAKSQINEGKIIVPYGVFPEKHEYDTVSVFLKLGLNVEFIKPQGTKRSKSADVIIGGIEWEIKSPTGGSKYTIQNQFKRAAQQSQNLIFNTRRTKLSAEFVEKEIMKQFTLRRSIKRVKFITKSGEIIDYQK